jgi:foldase protein PrsA
MLKLPQFPKMSKPNIKLPKLPSKMSLSSVKSGFGNIAQATDKYLNGKVTNKFVNHPAVRWGVLGAIIVYLAVGAVTGWKTYKVKSESLNIRRILTVYPFPAVLMPQDVILVRDYLDQLSYIRHFAEKTKQPLPADKDLRVQLTDQLIETRLLLRELKRHGSKVTKADIDAVYGKIAESNGGEQELTKLLTDLYGMKKNDFRLVIRDQLLREKIQSEVLTQVQVKHILITDEARAKDVLEQIKKDPAKFDELAKQYSEDTATRDNGGDLGFIGRGVFDPAFEEAAYKLQKDQLNDGVVKSQFGFHIIKLVDRKGTVDKNYADYLKELRSKKKIWVVYK